MRRVFVVLLFVLAWVLFTDVRQVSGQQPETMVTDDEVNEIAAELFCPLCTGLRLDNCDLPVCDGMRNAIREKLSAGESRDEIKAYFVEQYGDSVLGVPPREGFDLIAWVLPFVVLALAAAWASKTARFWARRREAEASIPRATAELPAEYSDRVERELRDWQ